MTVDALKDCNKKHLAQMAKDQGITGWHAMRKDQLIRALSVAAAVARQANEVGPPAEAGAGPQGRAPARSARIARGQRPWQALPRPRHRCRRPVSQRWITPARKTGSSS